MKQCRLSPHNAPPTPYKEGVGFWVKCQPLSTLHQLNPRSRFVIGTAVIISSSTLVTQKEATSAIPNITLHTGLLMINVVFSTLPSPLRHDFLAGCRFYTLKHYFHFSPSIDGWHILCDSVSKGLRCSEPTLLLRGLKPPCRGPLSEAAMAAHYFASTKEWFCMICFAFAFTFNNV